MSLEFRADRSLIRAHGESTRYLLARIEAPASPQRSGRLPVSIAFVLDRSGSMDGEKIRLAREAILAAIRGLRDHDRFSVVVYDDAWTSSCRRPRRPPRPGVRPRPLCAGSKPAA